MATSGRLTSKPTTPTHVGNFEAVVFLLNDVFAEVTKNEVAETSNGSIIFVNGVLTVVEKGHGVFIEWKPVETAQEANGEDWVLEGLSPPKEQAHKLQAYPYSMDVKDIRSYTYLDPKKGTSWIRFIAKDGSNSDTLHFRGGGYTDFVAVLNRYVTLTRSAKENNLVLFTDNHSDALEQSVNMLNLNKDIITRFTTNPYATILTGLSKVTSAMAPLLDPDSVITENQLRAMRMLEMKENQEDSKNLRSHKEDGFEHIFQLQLPERPEIVHREEPVNFETWNKFRNAEGKFLDVHSLKSLIFRGGLVKELRPTAWKYLLNFYKWENTDEENKKLKKEKTDEYYRMKLQWMTMSEDQVKRFSDFRDRQGLIDKDVARTDRSHPFFDRTKPANLQLLKDILMTYVMHDFDLGYVQGMSDFLSPILVLMENEVDAFWCFVGLMDRVHKNFEMDQLFIKQQLSNLKNLIEIVNPRLANYLESHDSDHMYFCFRWILVAFKREFNFDDIMYLWEVLWTDIPCKSFLLLFCVAILDQQVHLIIENKFGLTEILKHVNNLSMRIDLEKNLRSAEAIYHQLAAVQDKLPKHICEILSFAYDEEENNTQPK